MLSVDEAIVEILRGDGPCCFDEIVWPFPIIVGDKYLSPLIVCHETDCYALVP